MIGLTYNITAVSVVRHGVLRLTFADGLVGEFEVLDRMRGPVFAEARTDTGFALVRVDPGGGTVVWPGGADLAQVRFMHDSMLGYGPSGRGDLSVQLLLRALATPAVSTEARREHRTVPTISRFFDLGQRTST